MQSNKEIAVRLYENPLYGTTHGKGLYRTAMFNATADITDPSAKYLLDFDNFERWEHGGRNAEDDLLRQHVSSVVHSNMLVSWVQRYDTSSKAKVRVNGFCTIDLKANELTLLIDDEKLGIVDTWQLQFKPCRPVPGKKSPQLLATNAELNKV